MLKSETPDHWKPDQGVTDLLELYFVVDLVVDQQAGGPTGRPPQGRSGGAENGAGHQGECGRHHQIRLPVNRIIDMSSHICEHIYSGELQ